MGGNKFSSSDSPHEVVGKANIPPKIPESGLRSNKIELFLVKITNT